MQQDPRWLAAVSAAALQPYSLMQGNSKNDGGQIVLENPTASNKMHLLATGPNATTENGSVMVSGDWPLWVRYNPEGDPPAAGDDVGACSGENYISTGFYGFKVLATDTDRGASLITPSVSGAFLAKAQEAIAKNATGDIKISTTAGTLSDITIEAKNVGDAVESGDFVIGGWDVSGNPFFYKRGGGSPGGQYYRIYWKTTKITQTYDGTWNNATGTIVGPVEVSHGFFYNKKIPDFNFYQQQNKPSYSWGFSGVPSGLAIYIGTEKWAMPGTDYNNPSNYFDYIVQGGYIFPDFGGWSNAVSDYSGLSTNENGYLTGQRVDYYTFFSGSMVTGETDPNEGWDGSTTWIPPFWEMPTVPTSQQLGAGTYPQALWIYGSTPNTRQWS